MRITGVKAVYPSYRHVPPSWRTHFWQIVVRVETDSGVVGLGYGGGGLAAVEVVNRHFSELLAGRPVTSIEDIASIWDALYDASLPYGRKGIAVMALSGVDLALWDLLGKAQGRPAYDLIGTRTRDRVRAYATGGDPVQRRDLGFTAYKFPHRWAGLESDYDDAAGRAGAARDAFGPDALIMVDAYMSWDADVTLEMSRRLAAFDMYWFEDVLTPDDLEGQAALRDRVKPVLIAGGEHEFTQHGFAAIARAGALDLWQPDITWCGGITAGLRILEEARVAGVPVAPHRGGEVWGLHLVVASDCMDLAEAHSSVMGEERDVLWHGEPEVVDGYIVPSDLPGFGVTINEMML